MRRWILALALVGACGGKKEAKEEPAPAKADPKALTAALEAAATSDTPGSGVLRAVATACGAGCPCVDPAKGCKDRSPLVAAGEYLAAQWKEMPEADRTAFVSALSRVEVWQTTAPTGLTLPESKRTSEIPSWQVVTVAADGAMAAGRADRITFGDKGATSEPGVAPAAAAVAPNACSEREGWSGGSEGVGYKESPEAKLAARIKKGPAPLGWPTVLADAKVPARRVLEVMSELPIARAIGVSSGGRTFAMAAVACAGGHRSRALPLALAKGADPTQLATNSQTSVRLTVEDDVPFGEVVTAIEVLFEKGVDSIDLQSP